MNPNVVMMRMTPEHNRPALLAIGPPTHSSRLPILPINCPLSHLPNFQPLGWRLLLTSIPQFAAHIRIPLATSKWICVASLPSLQTTTQKGLAAHSQHLVFTEGRLLPIYPLRERSFLPQRLTQPPWSLFPPFGKAPSYESIILREREGED